MTCCLPQVILPPLGEYDVMVQIKACALSRIDTKVWGMLTWGEDRLGTMFMLHQTPEM